MTTSARDRPGGDPGGPPWTERSLTPSDGGWIGRPLAETRWLLEAIRLAGDPVLYGRGVPHGDGRAVVVLPGFLAGDMSLLALRTWLRTIGYQPATCGFAINVDCSDRTLDRIEARAARAAQATGRRVAIVGHSRGGHFARALAARRPDLISHAVSLGADLQGMFGISSPTRAAVGLARRALVASGRSRSPTCYRMRCSCRFVQDFTAPFPIDAVHLTSIYSKGDGVVRWQRAIVDEATNIEVSGSHIGLPANRRVYRELATALGQPERTSQ